ncbi:4Fe-4S single cluster domain-containing protein [Alkalinema sp. FACHB-956]|uniref:4Fe-4S single cluster domain-containing protein n=1 Tax=Alkalinema sp. FACHB-956 TaxID=2692768 RepID=UPI0016840BAA|nr:4Fe-4S single cluster domain-containing protein [Alkalinema sp. FACHB-956]MBD2328679.1 radical SAM protein [Alkalinema sp. FACHB-956]
MPSTIASTSTHHQPNQPPALPEIPPGYLNVMGYVDNSEVNGPGVRAVLWVQGCGRHCPGCFNSHSWPFEINQLVSVDEVVRQVLREPRNQGITFSGGEPFKQAVALAQVAKQLKAQGLTVMSFTGFTLEQLRSRQAPVGSQDLLDQLDILIDGPYVASQAIHSPNSPVSSSNQRVHVFNPALQHQIDWASDAVEIHILQDGQRIITGYRGHMAFSESEDESGMAFQSERGSHSATAPA